MAVDGNSEMGWWAVYTRYHHERAVSEMIAAKGLEVFLPLYKSVRHWKDREASLSTPLFPCYLFVREEADCRLPILTTPGVNMIVTLGGRSAMIPEGEIEALRKAVRGPGPVEPHPYLKCGERVRVIGGILSGVEGVLLRKGNACRLVISVDMLARSAAVEVNAADVTPVSAPTTMLPLASCAAIYSGLRPHDLAN